MKKAVLGRGLSALIPMEMPSLKESSPLEESLQTTLVSQLAETVSKTEDIQRDQLVSLPIESIVPNPYQPRIKFNDNKLKELSETIRQNGLIQPIVVRRNAGRFEIVSGERRWQASKLANLNTINVIIRSLDDKSMLESALIENIEREDLNPLEVAKAIRLLQDRFGLTQDEVAVRLSKDRSSISNLCRLLSLPDDVQKMLLDGQIEFGHAKAVLSVDGEVKRRELAAKIVGGGWSVRRAEEEARRINSEEGKEPSESRGGDGEWAALEQEFSRHLGTEARLQISTRGETVKGTLTLKIHTKDDVNRILGIARKGAIEARF